MVKFDLDDIRRGLITLHHSIARLFWVHGALILLPILSRSYPIHPISFGHERLGRHVSVQITNSSSPNRIFQSPFQLLGGARFELDVVVIQAFPTMLANLLSGCIDRHKRCFRLTHRHRSLVLPLSRGGSVVSRINHITRHKDVIYVVAVTKASIDLARS